MALSQVERNKRSRENLGIKQKVFALDKDTISLLEQLARDTNQTQVQVFKSALALYAEHIKTS